MKRSTRRSTARSRRSDGPVHVDAVERGRAEVDVAEARGDERPQKLVLPPTAKQRGHIHRCRARSCTGCRVPRRLRPTRCRCSRRLARSRIAEAAERHVVGLAMIPKVFRRLEAAPGIERADVQAGLAERLIAMPPPAPVPMTMTSKIFVTALTTSRAENVCAPDDRCAGTRANANRISVLDCRAPGSRFHSSKSPSP